LIKQTPQLILKHHYDKNTPDYFATESAQNKKTFKCTNTKAKSKKVLMKLTLQLILPQHH
jgi:hypothetical protein